MSSLPPPSALPPPQPPTPWQPPPHKEWSTTKTILVIVVALVVGVAFQTREEWSGTDRSSGKSNSSTSPFRYNWSGGVCNEDGFSGRFTNTDTKDFNGKVWAVAKIGGKVVARDEEGIFNLAPGESESIEFVWIADGSPTCSIESVDWRY